MNAPKVIIIVVLVAILGVLLVYSQKHDMTTAQQTQAPGAAGGYGQAPASGGYGSAPAAGGYGAPAPAAGGYGVPAAGGYGAPAPAAGGYGK